MSKFKTFLSYLLPISAACCIYFFLLQNTQLTLLPYAKSLDFLLGYHFFYSNGSGFEAVGSNFIITKSCSGINLFLSLNLIAIFGFSSSFKTKKSKIAASASFLFVSLFFAYFMTLLRIMISLPFLKSSHFNLIHTAISLLIFFGSCILFYELNSKVIKQIKTYTRSNENGK